MFFTHGTLPDTMLNSQGLQKKMEVVKLFSLLIQSNDPDLSFFASCQLISNSLKERKTTFTHFMLSEFYFSLTPFFSPPVFIRKQTQSINVLQVSLAHK